MTFKRFLAVIGLCVGVIFLVVIVQPSSGQNNIPSDSLQSSHDISSAQVATPDTPPGGLGLVLPPIGKYPMVPTPEVSLQVQADLPASVDLSGYLPPVGNQNPTQTCVAWAVSYYYKTLQQKLEHGYDLVDGSGDPLNSRIFSPNYVYNQLPGATDSCDSGTYIGDALALISGQGSFPPSNGYGDLPLAEFPWNPNDCSALPNEDQRTRALNYTGDSSPGSFGLLFENPWTWDKNNHPDSHPYSNNIDLIKSELADNNPVVLGIPIYSEFDAANPLNCFVTLPNDFNSWRGLHAVLAVGYDDSYATTGAIKIVNSYGTSYGCAGFAYLSYAFVEQYVIQAGIMTDRPDGPPPPPITSDTAGFIADVTLPDGAVVTPGTPLMKTWRVRNSGTTTWDGYSLAFQGGDQMGAASPVDIPYTEPEQEVDISIQIQAPDHSATGNWQIVNPAGTHVENGQLWLSLTVEDDSSPPPPSSDFTLFCVNCPASVEPGESFRPTLRAQIGSGQLLESRGDMLRHKSGDLYGAWPQVAVIGTVNQGQSYDFIFYEDNPITAPTAEGTYQTTWQLWQNGQWVGPERTIEFEVQSGGGSNHPPNAPTLTGPGDWAVYQGNGGIVLSAQHNGDPDGDAVNEYYFEIYDSAQNANSGWISGNSWSPQGLGFNGYQWHAKVRDSRGAESDWSGTWHFNIENNEPEIYDFHYETCRESWGGADKICFCAQTNAGTLRLQVNSATDGSANGEWKVLNELGTPNYNCSDDNDRPPNWGQLEAETGTHLVRLYARRDGGWENAAHSDISVYLAPERKPNSPPFRQPLFDDYVASLDIHLDWDQSLRTDDYHLELSNDSDFGNLLVDEQLVVGETEYDYTLPTDYQTVYWRITANGPYGSNGASSRFNVDIDPPTSSVNPLPSVATDTLFSVGWSGSDTRSGVRWYDIQMREGDRPDSTWEDWLTNTTKTAELFQGQAGHTYYFRVRAMDEIGNWEAWPEGDGDTYTLIDPTSIPPTAWWDDNYDEKRNLIVLNNDGDTIPVHYPMHVHFDGTTNPTAAEIYSASLTASKGNDVRITYNDQTELNRFVTHFTSSAIDIWFPLQSSLGGGQTDSSSYQIYYGYTDAGNPPSDINTVFLPEADGNTMGLWHFQEGSGSTVYDSSGRGHTGSFTSAGWTDGYLGRAGSFNGSDAYVNMGNHADFNLTSMTLEAWIYVTSSNYGHVISKWGSGGNSYFLRMMGGGNIQFQISGDGGNRDVASSEQLELNRWYHVAGVHDGGNNMWVYVNGYQRGHNGDSRTPFSSSSSFRIGRDPDWGGSAFPGLVQHVRISNIARHSFPYATIDVVPSVAAGGAIEPPTSGSANLVFNSLASYPNPDGGLIVQAIVENQGDRETQNDFYTDLYVDQLPAGPEDYTGSIRFWVNTSIAAGETISLTTVINDLPSEATTAHLHSVSGIEVSSTLYAQTDSSGVIGEPNNNDNIFSNGLDICLADDDAFEDDDTASMATSIAVGETQRHNIASLSDEDWLSFTATAGTTYQINTENLDEAADTYLYLYDTEGTTLLEANDDSDNTLASNITWTAPSSGLYYIQIRHWNPNAAGCGTGYDITLGEATTAAISSVSVSQVDIDIELSWMHLAQNNSYEVWRSTAPHFNPGDPEATRLPDPSIPSPGSNVTFIDSGAGQDNENYFYIIKAVNSFSEADSSPVGKFQFVISPGDSPIPTPTPTPIPTSTPTPVPQWHTETVSEQGYNSHTSTDIDQSDILHVAYRTNIGNQYEIWHGFMNDASWELEKVSSYNNFPSLAIAPDNIPSMAYRGFFARRVDGQWEQEWGSSGNGNSALAYDGYGYPHMASHDSDNSWLRYAYKDSIWHKETVETGVGGTKIAIAIDTNEFPHIVYQSGVNIRYAFKDAAGWHTETLATAAGESMSVDIQIQQDNSIHVVYIIDGQARYTYKDSGGWHEDSLGDALNLGISLVFNEQQLPCATFSRSDTGYSDHAYLIYACEVGSSWEYDTIDSGGTGYGSSLVFDDLGQPHIFYTDQDGYLRHAYYGE